MLAPALRAFLVATSLVVCANGCSAPADETTTESSENELTPRASYASVEGLHDDALRAALLGMVKDHSRVGYNRAREIIFNTSGFVDADGTVECVYTGRRVRSDGSRSPGGFNTEHSWPQSMGAAREPAKSDLHHLFAVDAVANSTRGNWPFGTATCLHDEAACSFEQAGSALGRDASGARTFEVRGEKRGDIARAHFYFSVRYELPIGASEEAALRAWNEEDPVDEAERTRNDAIETYQHNRNPFVDRPDFIAKISDF